MANSCPRAEAAEPGHPRTHTLESPSLCPQMEEIKVSPDYNWFRSTVPLKRVSSRLVTRLTPEQLDRRRCDEG